MDMQNTVQPLLYASEGTKQKWCKLQETVNCGKWFSMHSEFREIEGTWKNVVNDGKI
jgi:hypothetical protein